MVQVMAKLSKNDWVNAGFEALDIDGIEGVKVERLAQRLGVSKGSFYWHFKNREFLFRAMIDHWEEIATDGIINIVEGANSDASEKLEHLSRICFRPSNFDHVEANLRIWAARNSFIFDSCERVDKKRIAYVASLLHAMGIAKKKAKYRADIMYLALIGNSTWVHSGHSRMSKAELKELISMLTKQ